MDRRAFLQMVAAGAASAALPALVAATSEPINVLSYPIRYLRLGDEPLMALPNLIQVIYVPQQLGKSGALNWSLHAMEADPAEIAQGGVIRSRQWFQKKAELGLTKEVVPPYSPIDLWTMIFNPDLPAIVAGHDDEESIECWQSCAKA